MTRFASVRVFSPTSPNILSEQPWSYKLWYTPSGVETGQGVPGICVWGAIVGYPAAKPVPVWALRASQHHPASPSAASVAAGLLVQLQSNHCRGPQTEVSGHICCGREASVSFYSVALFMPMFNKDILHGGFMERSGSENVEKQNMIFCF